MELNELTALSPIDGRYAAKTRSLTPYFSEFALIQYRVRIEVEYFIALCEQGLPQLSAIDAKIFPSLRSIYQSFTLADAEKVKATEKITNHDIKSVEYFLKEKFETLGLAPYLEFIHFGLTSQDINNTAIPLSLKEAHETVVFPALQSVLGKLKECAVAWRAIPMLALTHGQPASPTNMGKEMGVFVYRLEEQLSLLAQIPFSAKFGGATGNFNAHHVAYPTHDWLAFAEQFVEETLGLKRARFTTQIENYDYLAAYFDALKRINTILLDFAKDVWQYISMGYFGQKIQKNEVGSSAMPHKVNPIDFENAEGNLGIANALLEHLAAKLPISRLQRDLTDSTVLRNLGTPLAHVLIATQSLEKGIGKLTLNETNIAADLEANWAVVAEAIQTILRREGYPKPYEALKELTRTGEKITQRTIHVFIDGLALSEDLKVELKQITPYNYTGIFPSLSK